MTESAIAAPVAEATAPMIELRKVSKWYGTFQALKEVSLSVRKGERMVICGPSGSGKSTVIRCINQLEQHQQGQMFVEGVELTARLQECRPGAARSRHGVPAVQPVSAS